MMWMVELVSETEICHIQINQVPYRETMVHIIGCCLMCIKGVGSGYLAACCQGGTILDPITVVWSCLRTLGNACTLELILALIQKYLHVHNTRF